MGLLLSVLNLRASYTLVGGGTRAGAFSLSIICAYREFMPSHSSGGDCINLHYLDSHPLVQYGPHGAYPAPVGDIFTTIK